MDPIIIVVSYGKKTPKEIVKSIIENNGSNEDQNGINISGKLTIYNCVIKTKYYENVVCLLPYDEDIKTIPQDILLRTESLIVYFDSEDRSFLEKIPPLSRVMIDNDIELGILLTEKLHNNSSSGITYEEVKITSNFTFDIIDLCSDHDSSESDTNESPHYEEVSQVLQNNIWSNVRNTNKNSSPFNESSAGVDTVEDQLENFEKLLNNIQNFKRASSSLGREAVLDQAEKLAELFENIMNED